MVMALPIFLPLATFGAGLAYVACRAIGERTARQHPLLLVLLLPYLVAPVETWFAVPGPAPRRPQRHRDRSIAGRGLAADRHGAGDRPRGAADRVPVPPRAAPPVEATLSGEGVGAVRYASFEGGLVFVETVHEWQDRKSIGFSIVRTRRPSARSRSARSAAHCSDLLDGQSYEIELISDRRVLLHLTSTHRLTTRFNWYAGLWTEPIMSELQRVILEVVKARSQLRPRR